MICQIGIHCKMVAVGTLFFGIDLHQTCAFDDDDDACDVFEILDTLVVLEVLVFFLLVMVAEDVLTFLVCRMETRAENRDEVDAFYQNMDTFSLLP